LRPTPWEWVAVIAFYAAVHYVNAYLWEDRRLKPGSHGERRTAVQSDPRTSSCRASYRDLQDAGYRARYVETFTLSHQRAHALLDVHLRRVETTVMQAMGQPVPVW